MPLSPPPRPSRPFLTCVQKAAPPRIRVGPPKTHMGPEGPRSGPGSASRHSTTPASAPPPRGGTFLHRPPGPTQGRPGPLTAEEHRRGTSKPEPGDDHRGERRTRRRRHRPGQARRLPPAAAGKRSGGRARGGAGRSRAGRRSGATRRGACGVKVRKIQNSSYSMAQIGRASCRERV